MTLEVEQLPLGAYQSNCYVVRRPDAAEAVVVDPGWPGESERIVEALAGARCVGILVTHGDLDHIAGVAELAEATGAPSTCRSRAGAARAPERVPAAGDRRHDPPARPEVALRGDEHLELAGIELQTLPVPGHTRRPPRLRRRRLPLLRRRALRRLGRPLRPAGRELGGAPRLDPHAGRSASRRDDRLSGHGPATTLERELATNPFLAELRTAGAVKIQAPRGTLDVLPADQPRRLAVLDAARSTAGGLRLRARRDADLRGHGALRADVGPGLGRRPEGDVHVRGPERPLADAAARGHRAGRARLPRARPPPEPQPVKTYYVGPMFRYAAPQKGRYREFWQIGFEAMGSDDPPSTPS